MKQIYLVNALPSWWKAGYVVPVPLSSSKIGEFFSISSTIVCWLILHFQIRSWLPSHSCQRCFLWVFSCGAVSEVLCTRGRAGHWHRSRTLLHPSLLLNSLLPKSLWQTWGWQSPPWNRKFWCLCDDHGGGLHESWRGWQQNVIARSWLNWAIIFNFIIWFAVCRSSLSRHSRSGKGPRTLSNQGSYVAILLSKYTKFMHTATPPQRLWVEFTMEECKP